MLPKSFNVTNHDHTQVWKHWKQFKNSDGPYIPDLSPSYFYVFEAVKEVIRWKIFGSDDEVIDGVKKVAAKTKFEVVQEENRRSCFSLVQGCWSWWRLCRKSSYPMSILKELYNKLPATDKLCCEAFSPNFVPSLRWLLSCYNHIPHGRSLPTFR